MRVSQAKDEKGSDSESEEDVGCEGLRMPSRRRRGKPADKKKAKDKEMRRKVSKGSPALSAPLAAAMSSAESAVGGVSASRPGSGASLAGGGGTSVRSGGRGAASVISLVPSAGASPSGAALAAGGDMGGNAYFSFSEALNGTKNRNAITGAKRHLGTLEGDTKRHAKLDREIKCFEYCLDLAPASLAAASVQTIQTAIREIRVLCGLQAPMTALFSLSMKFAHDLLRCEKWAEAVLYFKPWKDENDNLRFTETAPYFSCLVERCKD